MRAVAAVLLVTVAGFLFPAEVAGAGAASHECPVPAGAPAAGAVASGAASPCTQPDGAGCVMAPGCLSMVAVPASTGPGIPAPVAQAGGLVSGSILGPDRLRAGPPTPPPNS